MIDRYLAGETTQQLADHFGVSRQSIHARLVRSGVSRADQLAVLDAKVRALVERHFTAIEIADELHISRSRVTDSLRRLGISAPVRFALTRDEVDEAATRFFSGETLASLADHYGVRPQTLSKYLDEAGKRPRWKRRSASRG
ncbi:MAG: hypothetical protein ACTHQE_10060 [Thermomicrobiales bacterium]